MSRPVILLGVLVALGAAAGVALHRRQPSAPAPAPLAEAPAVAEDTGILPGMEQNPGQDSDPGSDSQVKILQSQVEYLQTQVDALQRENSALIDKLGSITGKSGPTMGGTPCAPPTGVAPDGAPPDFIGVGIQLVKTRELQDIPIVSLAVDREVVARQITQWLAAQYPPGHGPGLGRALAALGAIPQPVDTVAMKAAFLSHQIGGWYNRQEQTLYLSDSPDERENALALAYGYLFKRFGQRLFPQNSGSGSLDSRLARECLLAGDAALTRFLHAIRYPDTGGGGGVGEDPDDPSRSVPIPNFLRELELLPFGVGLDFMQAMHSIGGWDQVNATYDRPPVAGAEILDPEIYLGEKPFAPEVVDWTDKKVDGAVPVWEDTMGPLATVLLLKQHVAEPVAGNTAPGWSGDRWLTFPAKSSNRDHAVWQTLWKSSDAADAFFSAMRTGLLSRYKGASPAAGAARGVFQLDGPERYVILVRTHEGRGVLYIDAAEEAFARAAQTKFAPPPATR